MHLVWSDASMKARSTFYLCACLHNYFLELSVVPPPALWYGHAPNRALNKFQERQSGASRMQENLLAAGYLSRTSLGEIIAFPLTP